MTDLPDQTIAELLNQIGQGVDKAATRLYRHYHGFLYAYIRHRMADDAAAEELTHDVFIAVCRKPQAFTGQSKFPTWLCGIANHKVVDWWRKKGRALPMDDIHDDVIQAVPDPNWDFVARIEAAQEGAALRHCVDALPLQQRDAVFWVFYQAEGLQEVAIRQNCPVGTVKSRLFNARKRLRDCISRWLEGGRYG